MSLRRHDRSIMDNTFRRSRPMSSSECRRRELTARMWRAAEDCSRSERRRLESSVAVAWESGTGNRQLLWDDAERRRFRNSNSAGWWSSSARYDGARPWWSHNAVVAATIRPGPPYYTSACDCRSNRSRAAVVTTHNTLRWSVAVSTMRRQSSQLLKGSVKEPNMFHNMKLRKSLVKPVTRQKTCNYIELFGSFSRDRYARRRI